MPNRQRNKYRNKHRSRRKVRKLAIKGKVCLLRCRRSSNDVGLLRKGRRMCATLQQCFCCHAPADQTLLVLVYD